MLGTAVVVCMLALGHAFDGTVDDAASPRVRSTDARAVAWIRAGESASRTFRTLTERLSHSDLIVYVQIVDRISGGVAGQMYFVTSTATARYVRIEIVASKDAAEMVALIGHELQHAVEVADAPRVRDRESLAVLYLLKAERSYNRTEFDSIAARVVEERVRSEVAGVRGLPTSSPASLARLKR